MNTSGAGLRTAGPHWGCTINYSSPGVIERIGPDWDWIWIDGQHGELGYQDIVALVRACDLVQRPALVRVESHDSGGIGRVLDAGASGVIVPLVDTVEQARLIVQGAKFPPIGERSFGGRRVIDRFGRLYAETANADTLLVVQIETPAALENVDGIAAVAGVDALFFSGDDLNLRRGRKMNEPSSPEALAPSVGLVGAACRKHGKLAVMVARSLEMIAMSLTHGYNLIVAGSDVAFLADSSRQISSQVRKAVQTNAHSGQPIVVNVSGNGHRRRKSNAGRR